MNELPKVSSFKIDKKLDNYQERFYGSNEFVKKDSRINVTSKINDIFAANNHVYKSRVRIILDNDIIEKTIIGKTNEYLLTINGEKIRLSEIIDIEKI